MRRIVAPLLEWYRENQRILPWRENTEPYRIWISEIMLQQTRVEAVKEYYLRFLERFPDVAALAAAREDEVLKYWEGLGYYSRARNLHKTARILMENYGGNFPGDFAELRKLPGIGEYTAGAIASIAFELPTPAVDGNVLRVLSRVCKDRRCVDEPAVKRDLSRQLSEVYPPGHCGDFTQSLMELGATVCLPNGAPRCEVCPLNALCLAHQDSSELAYPARAEKRPRKVQELTVLLLLCDGKIALRQRTEKGLLSGMWELPNLPEKLPEDALPQALKECGIDAQSYAPLGEKKHVFTHIEWHMRGYRVLCAAPCPGFRWVTPEQLQKDYALPAAFSKFLII